MYDQYGKEGLGQNGASHRHRRGNHGGFENSYDPFYEFTFRDPEDVFREFFGSSPFDSIFRGKFFLRSCVVVFMLKILLFQTLVLLFLRHGEITTSQYQPCFRLSTHLETLIHSLVIHLVVVV